MTRLNEIATTARVFLFALLGIFTLAAPAMSAEFRSEGLEIHRQNGKVLSFVVELALDSAQREQGLMNRKAMKLDRGMLFDFGESRQVFMWMKNTYLPLDMLFISDKGKITLIQHDRQPLSENIIDSHGPVRFVLEINGGISETLGIQVGDTVSSMLIERVKGQK